jgi:hypothetical protein
LGQSYDGEGVRLGDVGDGRPPNVSDDIRVAVNPGAEERRRDQNGEDEIHGEDLVLKRSELLSS